MRAMLRLRVLSVLVLLAWMPSFSAHAQEPAPVDFRSMVGMISRLYGLLEYEAAFSQIQAARQNPLGTHELVVLFLYEGIILFEMGRVEDSGDAFQMALLLRPDAKLPEQVAPKVEAHFETARRLAREPAQPDGARSASPGVECSVSPIQATGRNLRAQQLWRLESMERMLCRRGALRGPVASALSSLTIQMGQATEHAERVRISQVIDRIATQLSVFPTNATWTQAKDSAPEDMWEAVGEDPERPLPEAPAEPEVDESPSTDPSNLFGCRAAVADECERLMMRLLQLQNQMQGLDAERKARAAKELFRLGQRVREAVVPSELEQASLSADAWSQKWN
ncbi:hypothetical protein [Melittangium boletus]|uniref:hypothetical protein n=1 Tax=Melittangium boletus TaxID=83453 RepID=UPI0012FD122D|nr:hypothetical protein [Melittangium boletus]